MKWAISGSAVGDRGCEYSDGTSLLGFESAVEGKSEKILRPVTLSF